MSRYKLTNNYGDKHIQLGPVWPPNPACLALSQPGFVMSIMVRGMCRLGSTKMNSRERKRERERERERGNYCERARYL